MLGKKLVVQMCEIFHAWVCFTACCVDKALKEIVTLRSCGGKNKGCIGAFDSL